MRLIIEQNEWKDQQKRIATEENEKITKYIAEREESVKRLNEIERKKMLARAEQQEKMCSELDEIEVKIIQF